MPRAGSPKENRVEIYEMMVMLVILAVIVPLSIITRIFVRIESPRKYYRSFVRLTAALAIGELLTVLTGFAFFSQGMSASPLLFLLTGIVRLWAGFWWIASVVALHLTPMRLSAVPFAYLGGGILSTLCTFAIVLTSPTGYMNILFWEQLVFNAALLALALHTLKQIPTEPKVLGCKQHHELEGRTQS